MARKEKVAGQPTKCKYYLVDGPRNQKYPRSIQVELADKYENIWDSEGREWEEVTEEEMKTAGAKLDLTGNTKEEDGFN